MEGIYIEAREGELCYAHVIYHNGTEGYCLRTFSACTLEYIREKTRDILTNPNIFEYAPMGGLVSRK
jgi:hypothetical protein